MVAAPTSSRATTSPSFGLAAAAAQLIDYTLTVAVSIAAGVSAITSANPSLHVNRVVMSLGLIALLMVGNLRGLRESTKLFGVPVYAFVAVMLALIVAGSYQAMTGSAVPANTAFADFPRLASIVARDRFMPCQFMNLGDKLAFSNGIVALSVAAAFLCVVFSGDPHALIPL